MLISIFWAFFFTAPQTGSVVFRRVPDMKNMKLTQYACVIHHFKALEEGNAVETLLSDLSCPPPGEGQFSFFFWGGRGENMIIIKELITL